MSMKLESRQFVLQIDETTGAITSLVVKDLQCDLIGEPRLHANFRICLPLEDYQCNYIEGMNQKPAAVTQADDCITVRFSGLASDQGTYPIDLEYTIALAGDEIRFRSKLTNRDAHPISEFWFPRLGGWTRFGTGREAKVAVPGYLDCRHNIPIFKEFPNGQELGAEAAEWLTAYPGMMMPWTDLYETGSDTGLYLGYHDTIFRYSAWHYYLYPRDTGCPIGAWYKPDEAGGLPVGLVFSHIRHPFIQNGETFESGEFILRIHQGDWHHGSKFYRKWFMEHFPFDKSRSWLRKKSAWFSSIIYQPEDRVITDYVGYDQWCREARQSGIDTFELIGWDKGGLERDYPEYVPEPKLGGREGFRKLLKSINARGGKCLVFINYNILDQNTEWYKRELRPYTHQDLFGVTPNWMMWGESTLLARKGFARRHVLASIVPPLEKILEDFFLELVKDGAHGFQIDKLCVGSTLDFNPLNTLKPDVALCEGLVQAIGRLLAKCRAINPQFCIAAEAVQDRLIPYIDVYYRNSAGNSISPLRYVFPEWTACQHVSGPADFNGVNGAVLTGSVICVEPCMYQGSLAHPLYRALAEYIKEVERIRHELADIIFLGAYHDTLYAAVTPAKPVDKTATAATARRVGGEVMIPDGGGTGTNAAAAGELVFRVHGHRETDRRAIVVINTSREEMQYHWRFLHKEVAHATLQEPFAPVREVGRDQLLRIKGEGLHILVEPA